MIEIKNYDKEKQKLSFVTDMPISLANAVRRGILEVPVMAVDEIEISKNDSALYDEILAHRIGLIPIKTEKETKETKFKLQVQGPKTVYSTDFKPSFETGYKLPIVYLEKNQEVQLVANANLGRGIEHAKYSPGLIYYKNNIGKELLDYIYIDSNGKINYDEEELKDKGVSEEQINKIKKLSDNNELFFEIESWGQIDVQKILIEIINVLDKNLKELNKAIK